MPVKNHETAITVQEALAAILATVHVLEAETVHLLDALDRVLAEAVVAPADIPPFANSAMDGFAVRTEDVAACPVILRVIDEVAAGAVAHMPVAAGTAVRIMTGAPLPEGANAVVRFEDTDSDTDWVRIRRSVQPWENYRFAGEDVHAGETLLRPGVLVRPQEIGLLAAMGRACVQVVRRPRVALLATGDELLAIDEPLQPGKIRNSNEYSTAAQVLRYGGIPLRLGIARDTFAHLSAKIAHGLEQGADLFVTSAGVSKGDYDIVKDVLGGLGEMRFWQVLMKPGRPLAFGTVGTQRVPLIGLPGNPVAAMVSFEQFARPAIRKMLGYTVLDKPSVTATLLHDLRSTGRQSYVRVLVTRRENTYYAQQAGDQGAGVLTSMVQANGLLVIPEGVQQGLAGEHFQVQMLDWPEWIAALEQNTAPQVGIEVNNEQTEATCC